MTTIQKVIKYLAIALAIFLTVSIIGGILGALGVVGLFTKKDPVAEELKTYSDFSEIRNLDIEINAADISIKEGTSFSVESNLKHLKVRETGGHLSLVDNSTFRVNYKTFREDHNHAVLTIYVPAGTVFDKVLLTTGAGRLYIESLTSDVLDFELGAGEVTIDTLSTTKSAEIEGGAGKITISNGELHNLDLDMGVGELNLTAALQGRSDLNFGVGESNLTLLGSRDDYRVDIEKGIGSITVDGKTVSDFGTGGNGANRVEIEGGIGAINVKFQNP